MYHLLTPVLCSVPLCCAAEKGLWLITILKPGSAGLEYLNQVNVETGFAVLSWYISADVVGGKTLNHIQQLLYYVAFLIYSIKSNRFD